MTSQEDILIRIKGQDQTGNAFSSVGEKASQMKSMVSSAVSMTIGMVGYDLVTSFIDAGREAINASGQLDYFVNRLGMSESQSANFRNELDNMQNDFKKVNMTAVGATAADIASRYNLPIEKVGDLTQMTAVMSSEFIRNGRTQEDAVLAVADAMDGQFKRLQEIGITQDMLMQNGWSGDLSDQAGLIDALNKSMHNMGYDDIAKDITNLDDAYTALTVAGGNFIASVLVPITPYILQFVDGLIKALDFIKNNGWAQGAILIGGLAVGFMLLAGSLFTAEGAFIGWQAAMPGFITSLYGAASGFMAISVAGAPLWLIVAALAAIAFAVYEVGIYFGWWTDLSSMLAAISDGVRRLWEAFINSPQVQGAIKMIQSALQQLWDFIQPFVSWVQAEWVNLFGGEGSNPDAVRMIWQAFQQLGEIAEQIFPYIVQGFQTIQWILTPVWEGLMQIAGVFSQLMNGSISWEDAFVQIITNIGNILIGFWGRVGQIAYQIGSRLLTGIITYARQIAPRIWAFLNQAGLRLSLFSNMAFARARAAGMRILQGIASYVMQIPGRVGSYLSQVPGRIASAAGAAAGAAMSLATQVVQAVIQGVTGLADAVYQEFINIGSKISEAVSSAVSAALSFGNDIKNAVLGALGIASPGIIQRKIAIEFEDIPGRIGESADYVYSAARDYAGNIFRGFNAPQIGLGGMGAVRQNVGYTPNTGNMGNTTIIYVQEGAMPLNAHNLTAKEATSVVITAFESLGANPTPNNGGQ